jgi:predicted NBD/HSP70 family sugar kinase
MDRNEDSAAAVIRVIREQGPINRSAIARRTGLSPSAVTMLTKHLVDVGIVVEQDSPSAGKTDRLGRPPILLRLEPGLAAIAGAKLDDGELSAVLTDLDGRVLARRTRRLSTRHPERVVASTGGLLSQLAEAAKVPEGSIAGVGLGLSGLVDNERGCCIRSVVLDWADVPIGPMLEQALGLPVAVENDANTLAIGEQMFGRARGLEDFAVVSFGKGIGAGLVVGGRLYRGRFGVAGEVGHCTVREDGPLCACGKHGCLEAVASVPATLARATEAGLHVKRLDDLGLLANEGDPRAVGLLADIGDAIGLALSHLVNLINPEILILTGSGVAIGEPLRAAIADSLERHVFPSLPRLPELVVQRESRDMWARGAASLATQAYFEQRRWEVDRTS